ncbi:MAG: alpha/beta hydrolase [Allosphingosinicella sp.]|uniref:alpha/beta hydrolase n=1 Tax=Allosphingosinicella sp. TaxID=2823234 RepID=UPI00392A4D21
MIRRRFGSALTSFDTLVPKDRAGRRVAADLRYGDHPRHVYDLYAPRRARGPLPIILFFYGGSWASGLRQGYRFVGRALAARGFLVAIPDYRLVPEVRFPAFLEDGAAAFAAVRDRARDHGGDPDRIVLAGHSAGAWMAAMLALDRRWLARGHDAVRGLVGIAGPYDFLPLSGPVTQAAFGGAGDLDATQPVAFAGPHAPPALLLHGERDATVKPRNSTRLAGLLREAGADAEARLYPGIGHVAILTALALPFRRRAPVLADLADFARRCTMDRAAAGL